MIRALLFGGVAVAASLDYDERILPSIANEVLSNSSVPDCAEASCVADAVTSIMETEPFV